MKSITSTLIVLASLAALAMPSPATATTLNEIATLTGSDTEQGIDNFGIGMAIEGDTAVFGAYGHTWPVHYNSYEGAVYVFTRVSGVWQEQQKLDQPDRGDLNLGLSVALSGDTIVAGAPSSRFGDLYEAGAVYIFRDVGGGWIREARLGPPAPAEHDKFGHFVAIDGDIAAIGATGQDETNNLGIGSVHMYRRTGTTWDYEDTLTALAPRPDNDRFGWAIDVEGDTLMVGAHGDGRGSVYVFEYVNGAWAYQGKLWASGSGHAFGTSLSLDGDTLLVGASGGDSQGPLTGAAYVFKRTPSGWVEQTKLTAVCALAHDSFGYRVALDNGLALISAHVHNNERPGSAYVFTEDGQDWTERGKLIGSDVTTEHNFASRLALSGHTALVWHQVFPGSADVFDVSGILTAPPPESCDTPPVAIAGDDVSIDEGTSVTLDGTASYDPEQRSLTYEWTQVAGPAAFTQVTGPGLLWVEAPWVDENTTLTFQLVVDDGTFTSDPDFVDVTVINSNSPPVADAGDDNTIKEGAVATLNATFTYDPNGDDIEAYRWTQLSGLSVTLLPDNSVATPTFTAPIADGEVLVFKLEAFDGKEWSIPSAGTDSSFDDTVAILIVENSAPAANAGVDQTKDEAVSVALDGTASIDPDGGDMLDFLWTQTGGQPVTLTGADTATPTFVSPTVSAGGEDLVFTLVVTDDDPYNPLSGNDEVVVHVRNSNDPPSCDLAMGDTLWPPNHAMHTFEIDGVTDDDAVFNEVRITVTSVTQDEPTNDTGDGDTGPDAIIVALDPLDEVLIRAERAGNGNGRVYAVGFEADDGLEACSGLVSVTVAHNRKSTAVDDGQLYDSTQR